MDDGCGGDDLLELEFEFEFEVKCRASSQQHRQAITFRQPEVRQAASPVVGHPESHHWHCKIQPAITRSRCTSNDTTGNSHRRQLHLGLQLFSLSVEELNEQGERRV